MILAGISIATLTGDNGILTKATNAKNDIVVGEEKEEIKLAYNAALTEKLANNDSSKITSSELQVELDNLNAGATAEGENPIKVTFSKTGNEYTVNSKGNIKGAGESADMVSFTLNCDDMEIYGGTFEVEDGTTWEEFFSKKWPNDWSGKWFYRVSDGAIVYYLEEISGNAETDPLVDSNGKMVYKQSSILSGEYHRRGIGGGYIILRNGEIEPFGN